ncbi:MAG TPA: DUF4180 domain-containing protein [Bacteroides sp.]|nr:DUF4180 domain-containing protein [Bacteroides sp.]
MIKYHQTNSGQKVAEIISSTGTIKDPEALLDIMADAGYHDSSRIVIHEKSLPEDFFNLRSGLAGEILQKFSNYRVRLAVVGDFDNIESKSLRDFIRESNNRRVINFVKSLEEALSRLDS